MDKIRVLPVVLALGAYFVLAVLGHVVGYLYVRHVSGRLSGVIDVFVGRQLSPFPGGFMGEVRARGLIAFALGLVVALVIVALFVLLTSRSGPVGVLAGAWLGSILGTAAGNVLAVAVFVPALSESGSGGFGQMRWVSYLTSLQHGLYYGAVAGFFVGLVALLGVLGHRDRRTPVDSPTSAVR